MKAGRKPNKTRDSYRIRYGITRNVAKDMSRGFIDQLERCKNDAARRLLLGVSRKVAA